MAGDVPLLATPAWQTSGDLAVRSDGRRPAGLLLKLTTSDSVYHFSPVPARLIAVPAERWRDSASPEISCSLQASPDPRKLRVDPRSRRLLAGATVVETAGATALAARVSPSGRWVAVLSAAGPPDPSPLPFLTGGGASGEHFHQVLRLADLRPIGPAVKLPIDTSHRVFTPCWSPDEGFVIYSNHFHEQVSVVSVTADGGEDL